MGNDDTNGEGGMSSVLPTKIKPGWAIGYWPGSTMGDCHSPIAALQNEIDGLLMMHPETITQWEAAREKTVENRKKNKKRHTWKGRK